MAGFIDFQLALRNVMSSNARSLDTESVNWLCIKEIYSQPLFIGCVCVVCIYSGLFVRSLNQYVLGYGTIKAANKDQS